MNALRRLLLWLARGVPREDYYSEIEHGTYFLHMAREQAEQRFDAERALVYADKRLAEYERAVGEALAWIKQGCEPGTEADLLTQVANVLREVYNGSDNNDPNTDEP